MSGPAGVLVRAGAFIEIGVKEMRVLLFDHREPHAPERAAANMSMTLAAVKQTGATAATIDSVGLLTAAEASRWTGEVVTRDNVISLARLDARSSAVDDVYDIACTTTTLETPEQKITETIRVLIVE